MDFAQYISQVFAGFGFVDALQIILLVASVMYVYCYAARRNNTFLAYFLFVLVVLTFGFTFLCKDGRKGFFIVLFAVVIELYVLLTIILFRNDIRRDVFKASLAKRFLFFSTGEENVLSPEEIDANIAKIVKACQNMSKTDVGALIIVVKDNIYDYIIESGTYINAKISSELLETIFFPKSPLHDGAVIIKGDRILAAGCYLPLSQDVNLPKDFGTRHRAAMGITESHPSLTAIVVSEETGIITAMYDKHIKRYLDGSSLTNALQLCYDVKAAKDKDAFWRIGNYEE